LPDSTREGFEQHSAMRYRLEPEILSFAQFEKWRGKKVLEVGVGLGADHQKFAEAGAMLTGVDLGGRFAAGTALPAVLLVDLRVRTPSSRSPMT
jgi:2-polyprenyl-3-methyl-5-hydroxy-6-metoxy-1,4-benzoquinol methylase